ncbi:PREDICTED: U-box domain-containing protein 5-like isoform X1 [Nelumbo nucifera]|uniref:RING-type E3 ubiquitin transferase n=1 Tax=Nelumbo nucifera TaxID=4432 RepID=A0A1U7ZZV3_NELNU|nr:PREDICTED: U-box domain-containing protein 5-like isoform X1 [Nelumbo nucifera]
MGKDVAEVTQLLSCSNVKVHRLMCMELMKSVDQILWIFPYIESSRPRCTSGIEALCSINGAIEKAKLLIQYCTEASKLYLAIRGETMVARFERVRDELVRSLSQIQDMVPIVLAVEISGIINDLRTSEFLLESSEEEVGKVVLELIRKDVSMSGSMETSEAEAFKLAALRLKLTSPKALLIERRAIKKLIDKFHDTEKKERILKYLLYLLRKYGKSYEGDETENATAQYESVHSSEDYICSGAICGQSIDQKNDVEYGYRDARSYKSCTAIPPEEFRCPISSILMHDPVTIASGETFERAWIEKWLNEGNGTCPKTHKKLPHLSITPNYLMKDLICKWCTEHGVTIPSPCSQPIPAAFYSWKTSSSNSIASFGSSLNDAHLRIDVSTVSIDSSDVSYVSDSSHVKVTDSSSFISSQGNCNFHKSQSFESFNSEKISLLLSKLAALPWESQCKAVEDTKKHWKDNYRSCYFVLSNSSVDSLVRFLKCACDVNDTKAQRDGAQVLLALLRETSAIPPLSEEMFHLLVNFLNSEITEEALVIMEVLSSHRHCRSKIVMSGALPSILNMLDTQIREFQAPATRILYNLSLNRDIGSCILSLGCIPKLIPLFSDSLLAGHCIKILNNLCDIEEARKEVAETNGCLTSIAKLLETGNPEEQEYSVTVLLSLCSQCIKYCQMVTDEGVISSLVIISVNGNIGGKEGAMELLRILKDIRHNDHLESLTCHPGLDPDLSRDPAKHSKGKKPSSKAAHFFGRKLVIFSKP